MFAAGSHELPGYGEEKVWVRSGDPNQPTQAHVGPCRNPTVCAMPNPLASATLSQPMASESKSRRTTAGGWGRCRPSQESMWLRRDAD